MNSTTYYINTTIAGIIAIATILILACIPTYAEDMDYILVLPAAEEVTLTPTTVSLDDPNQETVEDFATEAVVMYRDLAIAAMERGLDELAQHYMNKASREEAAEQK